MPASGDDQERALYLSSKNLQQRVCGFLSPSLCVVCSCITAKGARLQTDPHLGSNCWPPVSVRTHAPGELSLRSSKAGINSLGVCPMSLSRVLLFLLLHILTPKLGCTINCDHEQRATLPALAGYRVRWRVHVAFLCACMPPKPLGGALLDISSMCKPVVAEPGPIKEERWPVATLPCGCR